MAKRSYTQEQIHEALSLSWQLQSPTKAAKQLGIPASTVQNWVTDTRRDEYERIVQMLRLSMDDKLIDGFAINAHAASEGTQEAISKTRKLLESGETKAAAEASQVVRNLATAYGIATDKSRVIAGKPTEIAKEGSMSAIEALEDLAKMVGVDLTDYGDRDTQAPSTLLKNWMTDSPREIEAGTMP